MSLEAVETPDRQIAGSSSTALAGVVVLERRTFADERGYFREAYRLRDLEPVLGRAPSFVQLNHSRSKQGVLRGLHAEHWEKLVYVPRGEVFTALADLREDSPTFGKVQTLELGEHQALAVFVPEGVAHGYYVLSDEADYVYLVSAYYDGSDTTAVAWDDPDLAVPWPSRTPVLSERDGRNPSFRDLFPARFR